MGSVATLFNRRVLDKYLSAFAVEGVQDYGGKQAEMLKWKKAIESSDLQKTKETSVQGKFLVSVFEKVLEYRTFLEGDELGEYNLVQELTSELDSTEADGSLGFFAADKGTRLVRAVIELKDATTDLDLRQRGHHYQTPVEQGFGYAHKNGSGCGWVIVSNFMEIRLYRSSSSLEYEEFSITKLDDEREFRRFYSLLCKDSLIDRHGKSPVDRLHDANCQAQVEISAQFYAKYSALRAELFRALKDGNPLVCQLKLFRCAQKILDRTIFICFCENRLLLPEGVFKKAVYVGQNTFSALENRVWGELRGLFGAIDVGHPPMKINGYNGGLFRPDPTLDALNVPDGALETLAGLLDYDYGSDLNVNILGHIFEQSISDIEALKAEIAGTKAPAKGKQKADGIYYTPQYVTQHIVKETIGRWAADRRGEIGFDALPALDASDFASVRVLRGGEIKYNEKIAAHVKALGAYRDALLDIKVLDPACGSGAFLNEAFDYIRAEGERIDNELSRLLKGQAANFRWDTHVLNCIFGVDLNEESIDITKLSLWLKTAAKEEKLANLDGNVKAGNSLIGFDWAAMFPAAMGKGGFDIVIGNPPYGAELSPEQKDYIAANYGTTEYNFDTYKTFMELGLKLTKRGGYMGLITPNTWLVLEKGANKLRKFLFDSHTLLGIAELFNVFPNAVVEPAISIFKNAPPNGGDPLEVISLPRKSGPTLTFIADGVRTAFVQSDLKAREGYSFNFRETEVERRIMEKINGAAKPLVDFFKVSKGVMPYSKGKGSPPQTQEIVDTKPFDGYEKIDDSWMPFTSGKTIGRYVDAWDGRYIKYGKWLAEPKPIELFSGEKLFIRRTGDYPVATYDTSLKICKNSIHCISHTDKNKTISLKYILGLINSALMKWIFRHENFHMVGKPFAEIKVVFVERFPIVVAKDQSRVISLADGLLKNCQARFDKAKQFTDYLTKAHTHRPPCERLSRFHALDFKELLEELKKQKTALSVKQEMELLPLFKEKSEEIRALTKTIAALDAEMDEAVYAIYGLDDAEKAVVKGCVIA